MARKQTTRAGYIRAGKRYVSLSFLLTLFVGFLALLTLYATAIHPLIVQKWLEMQSVPVFKIDSPYLTDYTGTVRLVRKDGSTLYEGSVANAAANGEGRLYENGALVYDGSFSENMYQGKGKRYYPDGTLMYEGSFEANTFAGEGVLYDGDGNIMYRGMFTEGLYSGLGKLYRDGSFIYEGSFELGLCNGEGTEYKDGVVTYSGSFANGLRDGQGTEYKDGELLYTGGFSSGKYSGSGKLYGKDDTLIYDGEFLSGKYNGRGKLYEKGVLLYEGEFSGGKYNGEGTEYDTATGFPLFSGKYSYNVRMKAGIEYDENGKPAAESETPAPRPDPLSLMGRGYSDVQTYLAKAGIAVREQAADENTLFLIDADAGIIYSFSLIEKGIPDAVTRIYYYGLLAADGIVVGSDVSDITRAENGSAGLNTPELLVLGHSNALWGRDISASDAHGLVYAGDIYAVTAFYQLPEFPEPPEDEIVTVYKPSGRIQFLRIEAAEKG